MKCQRFPIFKLLISLSNPSQFLALEICRPSIFFWKYYTVYHQPRLTPQFWQDSRLRGVRSIHKEKRYFSLKLVALSPSHFMFPKKSATQYIVKCSCCYILGVLLFFVIKSTLFFFPVLVTLYSDLHMAKGKETAISQYQSPMKKVQTFAINFCFKSTVGQFF